MSKITLKDLTSMMKESLQNAVNDTGCGILDDLQVIGMFDMPENSFVHISLYSGKVVWGCGAQDLITIKNENSSFQYTVNNPSIRSLLWEANESQERVFVVAVRVFSKDDINGFLEQRHIVSVI